MHDLDLILTLAGGFTAALILGYFTQRAGLSPIVGYLLAGTLVGPHTPGFVANALGLIEAILERLGATAEQIDRERDRARRELFGKEAAALPAKA